MNLSKCFSLSILSYCLFSLCDGSNCPKPSGLRNFFQQASTSTDSFDEQIDENEYAPMVMGFITGLQKLNLQLRQEIGEDIRLIAQYMSSDNGTSNSNEKTEPNIPISSFSTTFLPEAMIKAQDFLKIIKNIPDIDKTFIEKFKKLDSETKDACLVLMIEHEDLILFNTILDNKLMVPGDNHYAAALERMSETGLKRSDVMDSVLEKLSSYDLDAKSFGKTVRDIKIGTEFNLISAQYAIRNNDFPLLRRILANGLNPNSRIPNYGSLLSYSVYHDCLKCVEDLIEKGADVNATVELDVDVKFIELVKRENPFGWTPLMLAAANGNVRVVKALIASNKAQVSKASLMNKELNARSIARKIEDFGVLRLVLSELKPCPIDIGRIEMDLDTKIMTLDQAIETNDLRKVDRVFILGNTVLKESHLAKSLKDSSSKILELLCQELVPIDEYNQHDSLLNTLSTADKTEKINILKQYHLAKTIFLAKN